MLEGEIKRKVYNTVIQMPLVFGDYAGEIVTFLNKIWDLKDMPSTDGRYSNAHGDAIQHLENNDDWEMEYVFLERFNLIDGQEEHFIRFIETIVSPTVRKNQGEILLFVTTINDIIASSGSKLILSDYFEELPVFRYGESAVENELPVDIIKNSIPIYLDTSKKVRRYPCFRLGDDNWNDYSIRTLMDLYYDTDDSNTQSVGSVKIMKRGADTTWETLPETFTELGVDYCSLGTSSSYYRILKKLLDKEYTSFLLALRDVATFPRIHEQFEEDETYKISLIRSDEAERLARMVRFEIEGIAPNEYPSDQLQVLSSDFKL
jgi:hypothetical protein